MIEKIKKISILNLFCIIVWLSIGIFLGGLIFSNGGMYETLEDNLKSEIMFDHAEKIIASTKGKNLYNDVWESFPPFAYLLYNILYKINPTKISNEILMLSNKSNFSSLIREDVFKYAFDINFILQTIVLYGVFFILLTFVIKKYIKESNILNDLWVGIPIMFSYIVSMRCINSGNSVFITSIIISLALYYILYENNDVKKNVGIILLSVAFGLKLYPCLFSLIFINNKDYKSFVKFCICSALIFFVPFVFYGGVDGFIKYLSIIFDTNSGLQYNATCIAYPILEFLRNVLNMKNSDIRIVLSIVRYVFLIIMLIMFFLSNKNYQKVLFIASICMHYFPKAFDYNLIYYLPVILIFLKDNENKNLVNFLEKIIFILISTIFSYYFIFFGSAFYVNISFCIILLSIIECIKSKKNYKVFVIKSIFDEN